MTAPTTFWAAEYQKHRMGRDYRGFHDGWSYLRKFVERYGRWNFFDDDTLLDLTWTKTDADEIEGLGGWTYTKDGEAWKDDMELDEEKGEDPDDVDTHLPAMTRPMQGLAVKDEL